MISDEAAVLKYVHSGKLNTIEWMQFEARRPLPSFSSFGGKMAASSVTGTGPGESYGLYKIQNNGSCGCGYFPNSSKQNKPKRKTGCYTKYRSGGFSRYGFSSGSVSDKSCF